MPIQFDVSPATLALMGALLTGACYFFWWQHNHSVTDMSQGRKRLALGLRLTIVTFLFLAIAGLHWVKRNDNLTAVFLLDASRSIRDDQRERELAFFNQAAKSKPSTDKVAVVTFGGDAETKTAPVFQYSLNGLHHSRGANATNLEQALSYGLSLVPNGSAGKVVVLSDFNENVGSALGEVPALTARGVKVDTSLLGSSLKKEALIEKLVLPARVKIGEPFAVKVVLSALNTQRGRLRLMENGRPFGAGRDIDIPAGRRVQTFEAHIDQPGFYRFEAQLDTDPSEDTFPDNNKGLGFVSVRGRPQILYVSSEPALIEPLRRALKAQNIDVMYAPPTALPTTAAALQQFDSVILSDVQRPIFSDAQMTAIQVAVRDFGMGFAMIGGENSFGAGGYRNTPIEETLPVSLEVKKQKRMPSVAVALVIEDLEIPSTVNMSKEAAKALVNLLDPIDEVGVLDCNGWSGAGGGGANGSWRIPLQHCTDRAGISQAIDKLDNMGDPPSYDTYLVEAANKLQASEAKIKHIVFLGDGDAIYEAQQGGMRATMQRIRNMGITVSTVASGADQQGIVFMGAIAHDGGGQGYVADKPQDLPRILLKDQSTISQPPIVEEDFNPTQIPGAEVVTAIGAYPVLRGYNVSTPKATADVSLITHRKDPLLATWRYGLGRALAFTSDDRNKWAANWLPWAGYPQFWAQAIRWTMRSFTPSDFQTQVTTEGTRGHIAVDAIDKDGKFVNGLAFQARVVGPEADTGVVNPPVSLRQTGPGHYEAWFDAAQVGTYLVNVTRALKDKPAEMTVTGLVVPYSPEYKDLAANEFLTTQLAQAGGGSVLTSPEQVYNGKRPSVYSPVPLAHVLILLAMLLFPFDVGVRRLALQRDDFARALAWARSRGLGRRARRPGATPELARLMNVKGRAVAERESRGANEEGGDGTAPAEPTRPAAPARRPVAPPATPTGTPRRPTARPIEPTSQPATPAAAAEPTASEPAVEPAEDASSMSRLMAAKRRAQEQKKKE